MKPTPDEILSAEVPIVANRQRPERLVIVTDPAVGLVPVWWDLRRSSMWRCTIHGRATSPRCAHLRAAAHVLTLELFGQEPSTSSEAPAR